jgi:hypothetical protein
MPGNPLEIQESLRDAMDRIVDMQFHVRMRADVQVWLYEPGPQRAGLELAACPACWRWSRPGRWR